jgi:hypothetical protein
MSKIRSVLWHWLCTDFVLTVTKIQLFEYQVRVIWTSEHLLNWMLRFETSLQSEIWHTVCASWLCSEKRGCSFWNVFILLTNRCRVLCKYELTPRSRVFLDKLIVTQRVNEFPVFHKTRRSITLFTRPRHWSKESIPRPMSPCNIS